MLYRFPEKVFIDTAKDLVGQLQRACLLAFEIYYINLCHCFQLLAISSWLLARSRCSTRVFYLLSMNLVVSFWFQITRLPNYSITNLLLRLTCCCFLGSLQRIQCGRS